MQLAIGLFRECWGMQQPPLKAVRQRAQQLGYHYARLYFIAGNWWLSLATAECCDLVLCLSCQLNQHSDCWILVKHGQGPLLIRWHQGQLVRVCQQSLTACVEEFEQQCRDKTGVMCLQHGWNEPLPSPWQGAQQLDVKFSQQMLLALDQLHHLPIYRRRRRIQQGALLLLLLSLTTVIVWHLATPTKVKKSHVTTVLTTNWLPADQVMAVLVPVASVRWEGPWELTEVTLDGAQLVFNYRGHGPLALHSLQTTDSINWRPLPQSVQLKRRNQLLLAWQTRAADGGPSQQELQQEALILLAEQRPGLSLFQQGQRLTLRWQNWSLTQLSELVHRLLPLALHSHSATLQASANGWNGEWVLTSTGKIVQ